MKKTAPYFTTWLWLDSEAEEAANFYTGLFANASLGPVTRYGKAGFEFHQKPEGSVMTAEFSIGGQQFGLVNGGPIFKINPSISFFVVCESTEELNQLWTALSAGGAVLMPLDKYDWSEQYGWLQDKYGLSWQLSLGSLNDVAGQKITPSFLFVNQPGESRAEEAVKFYTSIFDNSSITGILKYKAGEDEPEGTVKHAQFSLLNQLFMAMDSSLAHQFSFNEGVAIAVNCDTQEQIDYFWEKLTNGGQEQPCGWLKDKFGVSWQVNPTGYAEIQNHPDKQKVQRVTEAYFQMTKVDLNLLKKIFEEA